MYSQYISAAVDVVSYCHRNVLIRKRKPEEVRKK